MNIAVEYRDLLMQWIIDHIKNNFIISVKYIFELKVYLYIRFHNRFSSENSKIWKYNTPCVNANTSIRDPHSHSRQHISEILNDEDRSIEYLYRDISPDSPKIRRYIFFFFHISFCCVDRMKRAVVRQPEKLVSEACVTGSAINTRDSKAQPMSRELPMFKNRSLLQRTCASWRSPEPFGKSNIAAI